MAKIYLETNIQAPVQRCFDLSRSISFHQAAAKNTREKATAGVREGLIGLGERVRWQAKHFGLWLEHEVEIVAFDPPYYFEDRQTAGHFREFVHIHRFKENSAGTTMLDILEFTAPYGFLGRLVDNILITRYLTQFLRDRNRHLKAALEGEDWKVYLYA